MNNTQKKNAPEAGTPETESRKKPTTISIDDNGEKIKIVVKKPGCISTIATIPNTLNALQGLVHGYIETVTLGNGLVLIMDEEGRLKGRSANIETKLYGTIVGTVLVTAADGDKFISLTPEQIQTARAWLMKCSI